MLFYDQVPSPYSTAPCDEIGNSQRLVVFGRPTLRFIVVVRFAAGFAAARDLVFVLVFGIPRGIMPLLF